MESLVLSSIEFSPASVSELDGRSKSFTVSKADIENISLQYGFAVERPITQAIVSIVLILLGLVMGAYPLYGMLVRNDLPFSYTALKLYAFAVPLVIIGGYYLRPFFVKRFYLLIYTRTDRRKLVFGDRISLGEVRAFVMNCNSSLGYEVKIETR
jgi:putative Mn2+ efflux pump MntP